MSVTEVPTVKVELQVDPQSIPAGLLVTLPLPEIPTSTVKKRVRTGGGTFLSVVTVSA